jgi:hypothetical protein
MGSGDSVGSAALYACAGDPADPLWVSSTC